MPVITYILALSALFFSDYTIEGHGFAGDTAILLCDKTRTVYLSDLCSRTHKKENRWCIASYDTVQESCTHGKVIKAGKAVSSATIQFAYYDEQLNTHAYVICTPLQEFYLCDSHSWVPAYLLKPEDRLFSAHGFCVVKSVEHHIGKQAVYLIEVATTHTFFVGRSGLLTHNMGLPCALNVGLSIPFGIAAGGSVGSFLGPVTIVAGAVVGSAIGIATQIICGNRLTEYKVGTCSEGWSDYLHFQEKHAPNDKQPPQGSSNNGGSNNKKLKKDDDNKKISEAIKGAKAAADKIAHDAQDKPKARNWNEYFENHEVGQKYKDHFEHTGIPNPKDGSPIRRIKADIPETEMFKRDRLVAPDKFHEDDHFEVWDKRGNWVGVANLDGSKNIQKTNAVKDIKARQLPK